MNNINILEKDFPILYRLRTPKTFFADIIIQLENGIRKIVFYGVILLILYIVYYRFNQYFASGVTSNLPTFSLNEDWAMWVWKTYRNLFYIIMVLDLGMVILASTIHILRNQISKVYRIVSNWLLLLLFITFSYAIAGFTFDIVLIFITINWSLLKQFGAPVSNTPFSFIEK